jgi:hypothetical protein
LAASLSRYCPPIALFIALLCAAPATAGVAPKLYGGQMRFGIGTASRTASGSCSGSAGLLGTLRLRCDSSAGAVTAKYVFTLPKNAGSVTAQVIFAGSHSGARVTTKRCSDTQFRVSVTQDSQGRADVESVMIEYYYPHG